MNGIFNLVLQNLGNKEVFIVEPYNHDSFICKLDELLFVRIEALNIVDNPESLTLQSRRLFLNLADYLMKHWYPGAGIGAAF